MERIDAYTEAAVVSGVVKTHEGRAQLFLCVKPRAICHDAAEDHVAAQSFLCYSAQEVEREEWLAPGETDTLYAHPGAFGEEAARNTHRESLPLLLDGAMRAAQIASHRRREEDLIRLKRMYGHTIYYIPNARIAIAETTGGSLRI